MAIFSFFTQAHPTIRIWRDREGTNREIIATVSSRHRCSAEEKEGYCFGARGGPVPDHGSTIRKLDHKVTRETIITKKKDEKRERSENKFFLREGGRRGNSIPINICAGMGYIKPINSLHPYRR